MSIFRSIWCPVCKMWDFEEGQRIKYKQLPKICFFRTRLSVRKEQIFLHENSGILRKKVLILSQRI